MPAFIAKQQTDILRNALAKLADTTPMTAVAPGSIIRALAEVITKELGDFYSILDYNTSMAFISSAQGRALDLIGSLYDTQRKTLSTVAAVDQSMGVFYFYLDSPYNADITIPLGTNVKTNDASFIGSQFTYVTTEQVRIPSGRTRVFVGIRPAATDSVFNAGVNTLTLHTFLSPVGTTVKCTNPKPVPAQVGFESDEAYRTRLVKSVRTSAGGTTEAMRFTALSIPGVRDVKVRSATFGLGSFEVVVTPESQVLGAGLIVAAATALEKVRPVGTRMFVKTPEYISVEVEAVATIRKVNNVDNGDVARRVEVGALRYLNTLLSGSTLIYNQLIQAMMESVDLVTDVTIRSFKINATEALRRNVTVEEDQQLIPGTITVGYTT
jgi:uncharacterized phage protein gp47/JayE